MTGIPLSSANKAAHSGFETPRECHEKKKIQQECIPVGCVPSAAVAMCIPAYTGQGGVSQHALGRGVYPSMHWAGGCLPRRVCVSQHALGKHPPLNRMTDRCKNITLPELRCVR